MKRAALGWLLVLASLAGAGACDSGEIVVFSATQAGSAGVDTSAGMAGLGVVAGAGSGNLGGSLAAAGSAGVVTSGAGGSGGNMVDKPCQTTDDCDPSLFCQKLDCFAAEGACLPRPVLEDPHQAPVCGCDHKTYWNDTLRQRSGISASSVGPCKSGAYPCSTSEDCCSSSDDCALAACSIQLPGPSACSMPGMGQCWFLPNDCASADDKFVALPCPSPTPPPCLTLCQALQARRPYVRLPPTWDCQ